MVIPLRLRGRLLGVLCLSRHQQPGFTFEDADNLGRIRNQMAAAIDGACLLEELRALTVAEERSRLGREMHDRMGGALGSATAYSSAATEMLLAGQIADANWAVSEVSRSLQEAYLDLRESIEGLRTKEVEPEEWVESLQEYVKRYEAQWGIRCEFQVSEGAAEACGAQGRVGLTRILSEALTNVRKHTQTRHALVSIRLEDGSVLAQVTDEGQGFDPSLPMPGHYGLESMRERAGSLGGEVSVDTSALGTQLTVRLPARYIP
jgi:signal transduction histidine kinase